MIRFVRWFFVAAVIVSACSGREGGGGSSSGGFDPSPPVDAGDCANKVRCSRDLRAVVDACDESHVITQCGTDEGCAEDRCAPACSAEVTGSASMGCEFAAVVPAADRGNDGSCFAAFVANTWSTPVKLEAEREGATLDLTVSARVVRTDGDEVTYEPFGGQLEPGQAAVLFLAQSGEPTGNEWVNCPDGIPTATQHAGMFGTRRGAAFRIKSSAPVSAYSMYPFGGAISRVPSATLLLPVPAWKTGYIVTDAWERSTNAEGKGLPTLQIVAAEDDTEVTLIGSVHVQSGIDVEAATRGVPHVYRLSRGEVLQFVQSQELTGSRVSANKNVAVFGGNQCMFVPSTVMACDTAQLQLFPVQSWGDEYVAVPYRSRRQGETPENYLYRVVAAADGTTLTYDPAPPENAPVTLDAGNNVLFSSREPFIVKTQDADHPIALYAYMAGCQAELNVGNDGDPEFTSVIPPSQYLGRYVFYVDPTFPNSQLVIVRARPPGKDFQPVRLDCAGELDGWTPLGTEGKYEYVRPRLTQRFVRQTIGSGTCGPGPHEIVSDGPVGVTVWGTDRASSYAYPGGAAIRKLNTVDPIGVH